MVEGKPALVPVPKPRVRRDHTLTEEALVKEVTERPSPGGLLPDDPARLPTYPVTPIRGVQRSVSYDAETKGHFFAPRNRDNTTPDAAHRPVRG